MKSFRAMTPADLEGKPIPPRGRRLGKIVWSGEPVQCRGEALHAVLWRGRQWAVTIYGLEARDGCYAIAADRVAEVWSPNGEPAWPLHMSEKIWVDVPDFVTAWLVALSLHGHGAAFAAAQIRAALKIARAA